MYLWPLLILLIGVGCYADNNNYCRDEPNAPGDPGKPQLDRSYRTEIYGKIIETRTMITLHEYYDHAERAFTMKTLSDGIYSSFILNIKDGKPSYSVHEDDCQVFPSYVNWYKVKEWLHFYSGLELMNKVDSSKWSYNGTSTLKGVEANCWRTCISGYDGNYTSEICISKQSNIPIRSWVRGVSPTGEINRVYDFFSFRFETPPASEFQPRPGVICNSNAVSTPPFPDSLYFAMEVIDPADKTVNNTYVYIQHDLQVMKETGVSQHRIRDYQRGIDFKFDADGRCTKQTFLKSKLAGVTNDSHGFMVMSSVQHLFHADGKFTYNGEYKVRGIQCDVYTKIGLDPNQHGISEYIMYFAKKGVIMHSHFTDSLVPDQPVVRIVTKGGQPMRILRQIEVYDFHPLSPHDEFDFDISACYDRDEKKYFKLLLNGQGYHQNRDRIFKNDVQKALTKQLDIDILRISIYKVYHGNGMTSVEGILYDKENSLGLYELTERMTLKNPGDHTVYANSSNTPTLCSARCSERWGCYFFDFNRKTKNCTLFFDPDDDSLVFAPSTNIYKKMIRTTYDRLDLRETWSRLKLAVNHGTLKFNVTDGGEFQAVTVTEQDTGVDRVDPLGSPLQQFEKGKAELITKPEEVLDQVTQDACARQCLTVIKYICEAFIYDDRENKCKLYTANTYSIDSSGDYDIYQRIYLSKFDKIPGRTVLYESDTVYTDISEDNTCAKLCILNKNFYCESFEMCGNTCLLGRTHFYKTKSSNVKKDTDCVHYSRSYLQEYQKTANKKALAMADTVVIKNVGARRCAHVCSTDTSYNCNAFEFCAVDSSCHISTKAVSNFRDLKFTSTGNCDLYTQKKEFQRAPKAQASGDGYTSGDMAWQAIVALLLTMILSMLLILVALKFRSRYSSSATIFSGSFSKKKLEEDLED